MTTKKQQEQDIIKREEDAKRQEDMARDAEKRRGTVGPLDQPPFDVHRPNPPSENG